jgi:hypothetical protein
LFSRECHTIKIKTTALAFFKKAAQSFSKPFFSGGGRNIDSAEALKEYLDSQPANSPDKPIKVSIRVDDAMIKNVAKVLKTSDKFVNLDLSRSSALAVIREKTFKEVKALAGVTLPDSVTSIGDNAFIGTSLTSISMPKNVTSIGNGAFSYCTNLANASIPDSVTNIGDSAFAWCISLASITIPAGVSGIEGGVFNGCAGLISITIPDGVTSIGGSAFNGCTSLANVNMGRGVTSIGLFAFYRCASLPSITIESGVTSIAYYAFFDCALLTSVEFKGAIPASGFDASAFTGGLRNAFYSSDAANGTPGKYIKASGGENWVKQQEA